MRTGRWLVSNHYSTWTSAIRRATSPISTLHTFRKMRRANVPIDSHAAVFTLKASAKISDPLLVRQIHSYLIKICLDTHLFVATSLLHGYVVCSFSNACQLFNEMLDRNVVTWNTMINGYNKCGNIMQGRALFDEMPERDLATWSVMINGYIGNGRVVQGFDLFREMMMKRLFKPDQMTIGALLLGCSYTTSLGLLGKSLHAYSEKNGWELNINLGTSLVDMYVKCGFLKSAARVFVRMPERNVITWSAMICGSALHGNGHEALLLFEKMKQIGIRPNEFTFTGILSACSHAGLVDDGIKNFHSMTKEFGIEPRIQHYGCVVDMLGKVGRIQEAYDFIKNMKLEPNVIVWSSYLAGCRLHKDFHMAERVIEHVLKMVKPDDDGGVYSLICDLYSMRGKWDDVERMRMKMMDVKVKKSRGSSFIKAEGERWL